MSPARLPRLCALLLALLATWQPQAMGEVLAACGLGGGAAAQSCCCPVPEQSSPGLSRPADCACCEAPQAPAERNRDGVKLLANAAHDVARRDGGAFGDEAAVVRPDLASRAVRRGVDVLRLHCVILD